MVFAGGFHWKLTAPFVPEKLPHFILNHSQPKNARIWGLTNPIVSHFVCVSPTTQKERPLQKTIFPPTKKKANLGQQQLIVSQEVQIWKTLIFSPYILKPIFGLISDLFPIAGLHKAGLFKPRFRAGGSSIFLFVLYFGGFVLCFGVV